MHQVWQIDAKENQSLSDGRPACWLSIVDEKTCGLIEAPVFSVAKISEVSPLQMQQALIKVFKHWGKPACIKVDNGRPLADPTKQQVPALALWLISQEIEVIFNKSYTPTDNAKVERMQGVSKSLVEPQKCKTYEELGTKLKQACQFQRRHYPTRTLNKNTRVSVYPELDQATGRVFDPKYCNLESVFSFLSKGKWTRKVSKVGQISFMHKRWQIGRKYTKQWVDIQLDLSTQNWKVYSDQGVLLNTFSGQFISEESIKNLSLFQ